MDLRNEYLHDNIKLYPPMNDYLQYTKFLKRKGILPNHLSKQFLKRSNDTNSKYLKDLKKKKELSFCEQILKYELEHDDKSSFFTSGDYLIDINDNILFMYYEICINKLSPLSKKEDYISVMNRLKSLSSITNKKIEILEKGIKEKVLLNKVIIDSFLKKSQTILDDKINPKNVPKDLKNKFIKFIDIYIIKNIKKLYLFVINKYLPHSIESLGLCSYKQGKRYYENICKSETMSNLTPEIIHDLGLRHLKEDLDLKSDLAKKLKVDDIDDYVYKSNKFYSSSDEIIKDLKSQRGLMHSKLNKYFFIISSYVELNFISII